MEISRFRNCVQTNCFFITMKSKLRNTHKNYVKYGLCQRWWYTGPLFGLFKSTLPLYFTISDIVHTFSKPDWLVWAWDQYWPLHFIEKLFCWVQLCAKTSQARYYMICVSFMFSLAVLAQSSTQKKSFSKKCHGQRWSHAKACKSITNSIGYSQDSPKKNNTI